MQYAEFEAITETIIASSQTNNAASSPANQPTRAELCHENLSSTQKDNLK